MPNYNSEEEMRRLAAMLGNPKTSQGVMTEMDANKIMQNLANVQMPNMQPDQEAMLRNQSISPYTPQGNVQMPNMQPFNIEGLLGTLGGAGVVANVGVRTDADNDRIMVDPRTGRRYPVNPAMVSGVMTDADATRMINPRSGRSYPVRGMVSDKEAELQMMKELYGVR